MKDNLKDSKQIQPDAFDQMLRNKLDGYGIPAPVESWEAIAAAASSPDRQPGAVPTRRVGFWISTAVAASVILLLGFFSLSRLLKLDINDSSNSTASVVSAPDVSNQITELIASTSSQNASKGDDIQIVSSKSTKSVKSSDKYAANLPDIEKNVNLNDADVILNNHSGELEQNISNILSENNKITDSVSTDTEIETETKSDKNKLQETILLNDKDLIASWEDPVNKKQSDDWRLSAGFAMNSGSPAAGSMDYFQEAMGDKFASSSAINAYIPAPNEFRNRTHHLPLSFGALISRKVGENLYVESGLVYTYLHTSFTNMGWGDWVADQKLHYLGLPVNLKKDLWKNKKWSIYISGGMMFEKGIWSVYEQHQYWLNADQLVMVEKQIDGWQYSLNGSTGFAMHLFDLTDLYLEPQISYFFDQGQPLSVRTEMPLNVGIKAGLRFGIKNK